MNKKNNRKGFTIVELVIVIAVIAILATVLVPTFGNVIKDAQNTALVNEVKNAHTQFAIEYAKTGVNTDNVVILYKGVYYEYISGQLQLDSEGTPAVATLSVDDLVYDAASKALATAHTYVADKDTSTAGDQPCCNVAAGGFCHVG